MQYNSYFGFNQQPKQEEPEIKLSEQMSIDEVPNSVQAKFVEAFNEIEKTKKLIKEGKDITNTENKKILESIHENAISNVFETLTSLGRQIDTGTKILKEFENDLAISKSDYTNSGSNKAHPSPFLLKYVDDIEKAAESLSQSIAAYSSHLQPQANAFGSDNQIENQALYSFLKEQSDAIYRCSTKVSKLIEKRNQVQRILIEKLKINTFIFPVEDDTVENSNVQSINSKYQQFLDQKKQKEKKNADKSDIFGNSTEEAKPTSPFQFGAGFGGGSFGTGAYSTGFGANKNTKTQGIGAANNGKSMYG